MSDETSETTGDAPAEPDVDALDESIDAAQQALGEARSRLADIPVEVVVTNHVMGLYELAAIHLSAGHSLSGRDAAVAMSMSGTSRPGSSKGAP